MTLDPMRDLQGALMAFLRAQGSLMPWLGTPPRVWDQPPAEVIYPYVTFGRGQVQDIGGNDAEVHEQGLNLMCVSRFGGAEEARAVAGELRALLDGAALSLSDQVLCSLRVVFVDVFRAADLRTTYALIRLRAVTEPK